MSEGLSAAPAPARPFWLRMERERKRLGWTKSKLASAVGASRATLDRLETQPNRPLASTVTRIAELLGIDRDEALQLAGLLEAADVPTAPTHIPSVQQLQDAEIEELLAALPPDRRRMLERVRQEEEERLERLRSIADQEAEIARKRFADLLREAAEHDRNGE